MSETGMDMLSDMHLSTVSDQLTIPTEQTALQIDMTGLTDTTDRPLELPQALQRRTTWTTRWTRTLIQAIIGNEDNRQCSECRRTSPP